MPANPVEPPAPRRPAPDPAQSGPADRSERARASADPEQATPPEIVGPVEHVGPLEIARYRKDDGRSLILYSLAEPPRG